MTQIVIPPIKTKTIEVTIVGKNLLMQKQDPNVAIDIDKKASNQVVSKDTRPESEKVASKIHYTPDGNIGFPSSGIKNGMLAVAPRINGPRNFPCKTDINQCIHFESEIIPLKYKEHLEHSCTVYRKSGTSKFPTLCIRPLFTKWSMKLKIEYNSEIFSAQQIIHLLNWAGYHCGLGSYRKENGGPFGGYEVTSGGKKNVK